LGSFSAWALSFFSFFQKMNDFSPSFSPWKQPVMAFVPVKQFSLKVSSTLFFVSHL